MKTTRNLTPKRKVKQGRIEYVLEDLELVRRKEFCRDLGAAFPAEGTAHAEAQGVLGIVRSPVWLEQGEGGGEGREGMGGGAEPCGLQGQLWLLAQGGLWAEEWQDLTRVLTSTLWWLWGE